MQGMGCGRSHCRGPIREAHIGAEGELRKSLAQRIIPSPKAHNNEFCLPSAVGSATQQTSLGTSPSKGNAGARGAVRLRL